MSIKYKYPILVLLLLIAFVWTAIPYINNERVTNKYGYEIDAMDKSSWMLKADIVFRRIIYRDNDRMDVLIVDKGPDLYGYTCYSESVHFLRKIRDNWHHETFHTYWSDCGTANDASEWYWYSWFWQREE